MIILFLTTVTCININQPWQNIEDELVNGTLYNGRLSIADVQHIMDSLQNTKIVSSYEIGQSYENRTIFGYYISYLAKLGKPGILITSLHHAREVASLQMNMYLFLKIVHAVVYTKCPYYTYLIKTITIWIIPFVNIDGYAYIESVINQNHQPMIRKNRNKGSVICNSEQNISYLRDQYGVDLNRNYGYKFGIDNQGSDQDQCAETYRGESAFSEKETQAVKFLVDKEPFLLNLNLHWYYVLQFISFGNLWIIPYSYGHEEFDNSSVAALVYSDFRKNSNFTNQMGNAKELINYYANGEAADWMLHENNIISLSPELGTQTNADFDSNFFPDQATTKKLFAEESQALIYFIQLLPFYPELIQNESIKQENTTILYVTFFNKGVSNSSNETTITFANCTNIEYSQIYEPNFNNSVTNTTYSNFTNQTLLRRSYIIFKIHYDEATDNIIINFNFQDASFKEFKIQLKEHPEIGDGILSNWFTQIVLLILFIIILTIIAKRFYRRYKLIEESRMNRQNINNILRDENEF